MKELEEACAHEVWLRLPPRPEPSSHVGPR